MSLLDRLERRFGRYAVPNLTMYLLIGQGFFFLVGVSQPALLEQLVLIPRQVLEGEVWRLLFFLFYPPTMSPLWIIFALYVLYLMGNALENHWGAFRYNVFVGVGFVLTVAAACVFPDQSVTNVFLMQSIFLAFAYLYPEFEFYIFFILPVKVKWLGLLALAFLCVELLTPGGGWHLRLVILAAVSNLVLFFGRDLMQRMRSGGRRMHRQVKAVEHVGEAFHTCVQCGRSDRSHPQLEFRYCDAGRGVQCFCVDHLPEGQQV